MGKRTSVYLSDGLHAEVLASGLPMAELIRRGLRNGPYPDVEVTRRALVLFRRQVDRLEEDRHPD